MMFWLAEHTMSWQALPLSEMPPCRLSFKAFPGDPSQHFGVITDEERERVAVLPVADLLAEYAAAGISAKKRAAAEAAGGAPKYFGVVHRKVEGKFTAQMRLQGAVRTIGRYTTAIEAAQAYDAAAFEAFAECVLQLWIQSCFQTLHVELCHNHTNMDTEAHPRAAVDAAALLMKLCLSYLMPEW